MARASIIGFRRIFGQALLCALGLGAALLQSACSITVYNGSERPAFYTASNAPRASGTRQWKSSPADQRVAAQPPISTAARPVEPPERVSAEPKHRGNGSDHAASRAAERARAAAHRDRVCVDVESDKAAQYRKDRPSDLVCSRD
jgi:hypothetical protein